MLSTEHLQSVYGCLAVQYVVSICSRVSKQWNRCLAQWTQLTISWGNHLIAEHFDAVVRKLIAKQLVGLEIHRYGTDNHMRALGMFTQLKCLDLGRCEMVTDQGLEDIGTLVRLQYINLWKCCISDRSMHRIGLLEHLEHLCVGECVQITNRGLESISRITTLQHLDIHGCVRVSDKGIVAISQITSLQYLDLWGCKCVTDAGIKSIGRLVRLQHLDLSRCEQITDNGLESIGQIAPLRYLCMYGCDGVTDIGLIGLCQNVRLEYLNLGKCARITDQGIVCVINCLKQLRNLRVSECDRLTNQAFAGLGGLEHLQSVYVYGCSRLTLSLEVLQYY
jgi:F-box/leucine-rich repeat protein 14